MSANNRLGSSGRVAITQLKRIAAAMAAAIRNHFRRAAGGAGGKGFSVSLGDIKSLDGASLEGEDAYQVAIMMRQGLQAVGYDALTHSTGQGIIIVAERAGLFTTRRIRQEAGGTAKRLGRRGFVMVILLVMFFVTSSSKWQASISPCISAGGSIDTVYGCIVGGR